MNCNSFLTTNGVGDLNQKSFDPDNQKPVELSSFDENTV